MSISFPFRLVSLQRLFPLALFLLFFLPAKTQEPTQQDDAYYAKQYAQLYKQYVKDPENVAHNLALAEFYSDTLNPQHNYPSAMKYISFAEKHYIVIIEDRDRFREVSKLIKKKITLNLVQQTKQYIIELGARELSDDTPLSDGMLDNYAEAFKEEPDILRLIDSKRMHTRFLLAKQANTLTAFKEIYITYPSTLESEASEKEMARLASEKIAAAQREEQVDSLLEGYLDVPAVKRTANARKSAIAYARLLVSPSPEAYHDFMRKYPGSDEYALVIDKMDDILEKEFALLSTPREYADFALENPDNPLAEKAMEKLKKMITDERDIRALKIYLEDFPLDVNYSDIFLLYYKWHTEEGNRAPIENFIKRYPSFPYRTTVEEDLAAADSREPYNVNMPFQEADFNSWKTKIYYLTGKKISFVALQRTLQQFIATKNWSKIPERIAFFDLSFDGECVEEIASLKAIVGAPDNKRITLTPMVLPAYDMMHPVLYPDGKHLYYNRMVDGTQVAYIAQLYENKNGNVWRAIGRVRFSNIENKGVSIYSFYDNGRKMLLGQNGNILTAEFHDSVWVALQLPEPVNSPYYDYDAFMLPDGSGILFASDRPEGYNMQPSRSNFHGDTALASDIYYVPFTNKGWGQPLNLGFHVNSQYMECSPSISSDLKTLYFITDGRGGLGYGDLYYTTRDNTDDWLHWATPTNYGKEVNTGFNEYSAVLDNDEKTLILCSNAKGRYGCYRIPAIHNSNNQFKNIQIKSLEVGFTVDIYDLSNNKQLVSQQTIEQNGSWSSSLYANKQYALLSHCDGLFMPGIQFSPGKIQQLTPTAYEARQLIEMTASGQALPLPCIVFESGTEALTPISNTEIAHLSDFLKRHPSLSVEFDVHVDGDDDAKCFNLSHARGQEIKKALVYSGIEEGRVIISGYGNSLTKQHKATTSVAVRFREL